MSALMKVKGIPLEMGDGNVWVIPPLTLGALERLQDRLQIDHVSTFDPAYIAVVIDTAHAALLRNYPDLTRDQVAELIDLENMPDVYQAVMDVSGLLRKQKAAEADTAAKAGNVEASQPEPQTGSPSSPTSQPAPAGA